MSTEAQTVQETPTGGIYAAAMAEMDTALSAVGADMGAEQPAKTEQAAQAETKEAPKAEDKAEQEKATEETGDDPADILAAAIRRDKDVGRKEAEFRKRQAEAQTIVEKAESLKAMLAAGDIIGMVRAIKPDADPNALYLELIEGLTKEDKPLSAEDVERIFKEKEEAKEKAAKEEKEKRDKEMYEAGVKNYMATCQSIIADEAKFPTLSFPGMLEFMQPRIIQYLEAYHDETKGIAPARPTIEMLEAKFAAEMRRRLGITPPAQQPAPTLTNANTADTSGAPPPAGRRESRYEQAMREADEALAKLAK